VASPIGHSLAGLTIYLAATPRTRVGQALREDWRRIVGFIALANLPDLDFLIGTIVYGHAERIHGGITHGLPFAVAVALVVALTWPTEDRGRSFLLCLAVLGSHGVIDLFTSHRGLGLVQTSGVTILSPFVREKIAPPFALFYGSLHGTWAKLMSLHNVVVVLYETVIFSALLGFVVFLKERRGDRR